MPEGTILAYEIRPGPCVGRRLGKHRDIRKTAGLPGEPARYLVQTLS